MQPLRAYLSLRSCLTGRQLREVGWLRLALLVRYSTLQRQIEPRQQRPEGGRIFCPDTGIYC